MHRHRPKRKLHIRFTIKVPKKFTISRFLLKRNGKNIERGTKCSTCKGSQFRLWYNRLINLTCKNLLDRRDRANLWFLRWRIDPLSQYRQITILSLCVSHQRNKRRKYEHNGRSNTNSDGHFSWSYEPLQGTCNGQEF